MINNNHMINVIGKIRQNLHSSIIAHSAKSEYS